MKKAIVALALAVVASTASATIAGSRHDLSATGPGVKGTLSACQYCHAPHNVNNSVTGTPLWNRALPVTTGYTFYTSTTVSATPTALRPNSATCMSCHDGQTNMGATYTGTQDLTVGVITNANGDLIGQDLTNDHPISIVYNGDGVNLKTTANATANGIKLYNGAVAGTVTIECASCHDPHVTGGTTTKFLRVAIGTICTECHLK